ncbi:hypothetical protein PoB_004023800 [Plakobranchus ocellatus]|uniref:Uncharacterized protein n=1 Tax=Plakobranchus ocellatus TaxID=259542 RepID=A0AAV4B2D2_9GAST|nr:hypothetical protein PoB_004023800 [Plakobranchus ocellatus]
MAEQLREAFCVKGLSVPEEMVSMIEEEIEVGKAGRCRVHARLYGAWRASTGGGRRVVWSSHPPSGQLSGQWLRQAQHLSLEDLSRMNWGAHPATSSRLEKLSVLEASFPKTKKNKKTLI